MHRASALVSPTSRAEADAVAGRGGDRRLARLIHDPAREVARSRTLAPETMTCRNGRRASNGSTSGASARTRRRAHGCRRHELVVGRVSSGAARNEHAGADRAQSRKIDAVMQQQRDAILHAQPEARPCVGAAIDAPCELGEGEGAGVVDDRGARFAPGGKMITAALYARGTVMRGGDCEWSACENIGSSTVTPARRAAGYSSHRGNHSSAASSAAAAAWRRGGPHRRCAARRPLRCLVEAAAPSQNVPTCVQCRARTRRSGPRKILCGRAGSRTAPGVVGTSPCRGRRRSGTHRRRTRRRRGCP